VNAGQRTHAHIPRRFLDIRNYLEANYHTPITLADLAGRAALVPPYFGQMFRRYFGTSPIDLVIRLRLEEAALLLGDVNRNVSEVAAAVGYDDVYHFSKLFKKRYGVSPLGYRKRKAAGSSGSWRGTVPRA
jgi:iron complex transport system substrate-binding protein